jgi:hypothetical protein
MMMCLGGLCVLCGFSFALQYSCFETDLRFFLCRSFSLQQHSSTIRRQSVNSAALKRCSTHEHPEQLRTESADAHHRSHPVRAAKILVILVTSVGRSAAACLPIDQALNHLGETQCVTGKVVRVTSGAGGVYYLDFCEDFRLCPFSVIVFSHDMKNRRCSVTSRQTDRDPRRNKRLR